jgi:hypothetical protein
MLPVTFQCSEIADRYVREIPFPERSARDALHLAIASLTGVDYLVTWNCTHIANTLVRRRLAKVNKALHPATPIIRTPQDMMEDRQ